MKTILNLLLTTILLTAVLLTANAQENDGDWRKYLDLWGGDRGRGRLGMGGGRGGDE